MTTYSHLLNLSRAGPSHIYTGSSTWQRDEHTLDLRSLREIVRMSPSPRKVVVRSTPRPGLPMDLPEEPPLVEPDLPKFDELLSVHPHSAANHDARTSSDEALPDAAAGDPQVAPEPGPPAARTP